MAKTAYINVRVEEEVKLRAEQILNELGINTSTAIDMFLSQIILKDGLPFDVRIPRINYEKAKKDLLTIHGLIEYQDTEWFEKIVSLYAKREINYDIALYAINKKLGLG